MTITGGNPLNPTNILYMFLDGNSISSDEYTSTLTSTIQSANQAQTWCGQSPSCSISCECAALIENGKNINLSFSQSVKKLIKLKHKFNVFINPFSFVYQAKSIPNHFLISKIPLI